MVMLSPRAVLSAPSFPAPATLDPETSLYPVSDSFRHPEITGRPLPSTERGYSGSTVRSAWRRDCSVFVDGGIP